MNETFAALGILSWKPLIAALLLPPVPLLLLVALAWYWRWRWRVRRALLGQLMLVAALLGLWLSHTQGLATLLERGLAPPSALAPAQLSELRRTLVGHKPLVLVLGSGTVALAPEYGEPLLVDAAMARLHYGLWLARQLASPVMVSGGSGHAQPDGPSEAAVSARVAARDYNITVRFQESASRDTRENARLSLLQLRAEGITEVFLVTHGWHMPRALRAFNHEALRSGFAARIIPAPMGMGTDVGPALLRWLPSPSGFLRVHQALRELLGLLFGA